MPWSIPAATFAGFTTGVAAGEKASQIAKKAGASERAERIVREATHAIVSTGVQWVVNLGMADPVGAAAAPVAAGTGAVIHQKAVDALRSGRSAAMVQSA